jgi:HEPN domain-containing protein
MKELAERWLRFAQEDLPMADSALDQQIYNQTCFHAQQCVEKSLQALIALRGHNTPRSHSISELLAALPEPQFDDATDDLSDLDNYYIPTRYPDALPGSLPDGLPSQVDAEIAVALARRVLQHAASVINAEDAAEDT